MKFYIAFSIHGTNSFQVFTKTAASLESLGKDFKEQPSRRPGYQESTDGIKLHWKGFNSSKGKPLRSPFWVAKRKEALLNLGWKETKERYRR